MFDLVFGRFRFFEVGYGFRFFVVFFFKSIRFSDSVRIPQFSVRFSFLQTKHSLSSLSCANTYIGGHIGRTSACVLYDSKQLERERNEKRLARVAEQE